VIRQVVRTKKAVGDLRSQEDGSLNCSRSHNTQRQPQEGSVPDRRSRIIPEVVLVGRWVAGVLGIWRGEDLGKGLGQGRSVYKQPETELDVSCHSYKGSK
jgi:hypothetical protein